MQSGLTFMQLRVKMKVFNIQFSDGRPGVTIYGAVSLADYLGREGFKFIPQVRREDLNLGRNYANEALRIIVFEEGEM